MEVFIKNKIMTIGGSSVVVDAEKKPVYKIKGKIFSPTRKKIIMDMEGNKLFVVRNRWFNFFVHSCYVFDADKQKIAKVKDKFFNFKKEYFVTGYKDEIKTEGNFFSLTYNIFRNGEQIGTLKRQITFIADAFGLEAKEEDIPFLIALVVAIDNITDKRRGSLN